jgi:hypothetical protein
LFSEFFKIIWKFQKCFVPLYYQNKKKKKLQKTWQIQKIYAYKEWTLKILVKHKYSAIKFGNKGKLKLAKVHKKKKILYIGIWAPNPVKYMTNLVWARSYNRPTSKNKQGETSPCAIIIKVALYAEYSLMLKIARVIIAMCPIDE